MINNKALKIVVIAFVAGVLAMCGKPAKPPDKIEFYHDLQAAKSDATEKNQPLVIEFFKPDCPWSKMFDDSTFSHKIVIGMTETMIFVKIDASVDSLTARQYNVSFFPTIVVASSAGIEIDRLVGYYPPADFFNEIQLYLQDNETLEDYHTRLIDEPENVEYHLIIAEKYKHRSAWDKAIEYYNNVLNLNTENALFERENAMFGIADVLCEKGDYRQAIISFNEFMKEFPESDKIENVSRKIPYCLAMIGEYMQAADLYREYLDKYPDGEYVAWVKDRINELNQATGEGN